MPDTGKLEYLELPIQDQDVGVETGVRQGDEISVYYDPMIAKVIVRGLDRLEALRRLDRALSEFHVVGVRTNIALIRRIIDQEVFQDGAVDTGFIKQYHETLFKPQSLSVKQIALVAVLPIIAEQRDDQVNPWSSTNSLTGFISKQGIVNLKLGDKLVKCLIKPQGSDQFLVTMVVFTLSRGRGEILITRRRMRWSPSRSERKSKIEMEGKRSTRW